MVKKLVLAMSAITLAVVSIPVRTSAAGLLHHPRYLHARSDLRVAQLMMQVHDEPNVMRHVHAVDFEIGRAIYELDHASVLDHKDIDDHPHVDTSLDRPGRFRRVMALLVSARGDISQEEDNPRAIAWRDDAFRHIDTAMDQLRRAARDLRMDHLEGF
ncbi:MAG TPA: hypothetical protein VI756_29905 [Blastocatellia bacterium]